MITKEDAKKVGMRQAAKAVTAGLFIAYLVMTLFSLNDGLVNSIVWFTKFDYTLNLLIAIIVIYICGYFYGSLAGYAILIKGWNDMLTGFLCGFLTLITSTFFSSWVGFFQESSKNIGPNDTPFADYIIKPVFLVAVFGFIPVLFVGFWFGNSISKKGAKVIHTKL